MDAISKEKKGALYGGSYITHLAKNLRIFDTFPNLTHVCNMLPFNLTMMRKIRLDKVRDGRYILIEHLVELGDDEHPLAPPHITQAPLPLSHLAGPSSSYPPHIEATLLLCH